MIGSLPRNLRGASETGGACKTRCRAALRRRQRRSCRQPGRRSKRRQKYRVAKVVDRIGRDSAASLSNRADQNARPFHQSHCIEQNNQNGQRERYGNRRERRARFCASVSTMPSSSRCSHGDFHAHRCNRAINPPHPRSTRSTANRRNRYRIEKAKRLRLACSAGARFAKNLPASIDHDSARYRGGDPVERPA